MNFLKKVRDQPLEDVIEIFHGLQDYTALKAAVTCEREDVVELLLEKNCSVNKNIDTPLHIAVRLGNVKCIQMLLKRNASITVVNADGDTPLHIAFQDKKMDIVDLLLDAIEQTSDYLNIKNKQDLTHLHIALVRANKTVVEGFVAVASNMIKVIANYTSYQELQSIKNQQSGKRKQETIEIGREVISPTVSNLKSLAVTDDLPSSPESAKSDDSDMELTSPTVSNLKSLAATDDLSSSPVSVKSGDSDNEKNLKLYKKNSDEAEFHKVCGEGHPDIVRDYLQAGWNVNALLKDLGSPLHCAVRKSQVENVKVLLEHGADVMLVDKDQATPLHLCLYYNNPMESSEILKLLYEAAKEKNMHLEDKNGTSFFHIAASMNDLETVRCYLDQGEDVNQKIKSHNYLSFHTPLYFAVKYGHQEMVELLVEHGADVNSDVDIPLHVACQYGYQGIIELLLRKGARADTTKVSDRIALQLLVKHIAEYKWMKVNAGGCGNEKKIARNDHRRKVNLVNSCFHKLIEAGCDINAKDENGNTALHYACATKTCNRISILRLLQLGADVNVENHKGKTPMEMRDLNWYYGVVTDFMLLYHHVQELKALGMEVNPKNEAYCKKIIEKKTEWSKHGDWNLNGKLLSDEELAAKNKQRLDEIDKMKKVMLTKKVSLYRFVTCESKSYHVSERNENLLTILQEIFTQKGYPVYGSRIWLRWKKCPEILHDNNETKRKSITMDTECTSDSKRLCIDL